MSLGYNLAQVNIGRLKGQQAAPEMRDFVDNLDRINALAEDQPGFIWRLVGEGANAMDVKAFDDPNMIINMSVWDGLDNLAAFVYRTTHRDIMRRRREWFHEMAIYQALWWVPTGQRPTVAEAQSRLALLEREGPTTAAFTFQAPFAAPDAARSPTPILERCA